MISRDTRATLGWPHTAPQWRTTPPRAARTALTCARAAARRRMGGAHTSAEWRARAVKAYYWSKGNVKDAVRWLKTNYGSPPAADLAGFIARWARMFEKRFTVADAPRTGQPIKLPQDEVDKCVERFADGIIVDGVQRCHYHSLREACTYDSYYELVLARYMVTEETLWRRMRETGKLKRRKEEVKWDFSRVEQHLRVMSAKEAHELHLATNGASTDGLIFLDEASLYIDAREGSWVWCREHEHPMLLTQAWRQKSKRKLKWYLAVNKLMGLVKLDFVTGTTDMKQQFTVRAYTLP